MGSYEDQDWTSVGFGGNAGQAVPLEDYDYRDYR